MKAVHIGDQPSGSSPSQTANSGQIDSELNVLVVGAGVGGLTVALELHRRGANVQIVERTASENQLGDTFGIGPTALNGYKKHFPELYTDLQKVAFDPVMYWHKHTGEFILGPTRFTYGKGLNGKGETMARFSRPALHKALLDHAERNGLKIEYGITAKDYFEDLEMHKAGIVTTEGIQHEADLVVAADGNRTSSWKLIGGTKPAARSTGRSVFRTAFPKEYATKDPIVKAILDKHDEPFFNIYQGGGGFGGMGMTPTQFTWALIHPDTIGAEEHWGNRVDPEDAAKVAESMPGWDPLMARIIRTTPKDMLIDWKLMFRDPQPEWASPGGLVVQLGDSAHTFLPTSGNGATQAIEDSWSLAACISAAGKGNHARATKVHCKLRFERVNCFQLFGWERQMAHKADLAEQKQQSMEQPFGRWMWDHDPEVYAIENYGEALQAIENGTEFISTNAVPGYTYKPWTVDDMLAIDKAGRKLELEGEWYV